MALWIIKNIFYRAGYLKDEKMQISRFKSLYPNKEETKEYYCFLCKRISYIILVVLGVSIISILYQISETKESYFISDTTIQKPSIGTKKIELDYKVKKGTKGKLSFVLKAAKKTGEELEIYLEHIRGVIEKKMLSENSSVEQALSNLNFIEEIDGFSIVWNFDHIIIRADGSFNQENLLKDGTITTVYAVLDYYGDKIEFQIPLLIFPKKENQEIELKKEIEEVIQKTVENNIYNPVLELPKETKGDSILWSKTKEYGTQKLIIFGVALSICLWFAAEKELKKKEEIRKKQMMLDYSDIISKLTLLLSAGMTIRAAWERITIDYQNYKRITEFHYAYEEMCITVHELELGVAEVAAYESFGKRCAILPFMKFSTILVQNLKKGTKSIIPLLEQEVLTAFSERKELAKKLGEEASTKLLGPMMIQLIIVLLLILIPAFISFY